MSVEGQSTHLSTNLPRELMQESNFLETSRTVLGKEGHEDGPLLKS